MTASIPNIVFKFCTAAGGTAVLQSRSLFITSPLDLNDPFEMRPAWTDAHEQRFQDDQQLRNSMVAGMPLHAAMSDGTCPKIGTMPKLTETPAGDVEQQRGIADMHNEQVFRLLHEHYRILSFSTGILDLTQSHADSDESTTLLWSHYADSFQGMCLAFDASKFDNGIQSGGHRVNYPPTRASLPPSFYDVYQRLRGDKVNFSGVQFEQDPESGLLLMPHNRDERVKEQLVRFLTEKSPAWAYEREVRMIYDYPIIRASPQYDSPKSVCLECQKLKKPLDQCANPTFRDAVRLPADAVLAVIVGTEASRAAVWEILGVLSNPDFAHVAVYWSSLHSDRYLLQYNRDNQEAEERYSLFIQGHREKQVAQAKGHVRYEKNAMRYIPAKKTVNYLPKAVEAVKAAHPSQP